MHAGEGGEDVVLEFGVGGQIAGADPDEVVGIAEEPLCLKHIGNGGESAFEGEQGLAILLFHGDEYQRLETQPQGLGVDQGPISANHAAALQITQPPMGR